MNPNLYLKIFATNLRILWIVAKFSIAALIIAVPIRWFVAQPFLVSGYSMAPTFGDREYLVIDKLWYRFHAPQRGDAITMQYPLDPSIYLVKRVIGIPGDIVSTGNRKVTVVTPSGKSMNLVEPYIIPSLEEEQKSATILQEGEYFVLGDNRMQSSDSREWGPLKSKFITGRVFVRIFPLSKLEMLPGQYRFSGE
jgi:signal peptidase I